MALNFLPPGIPPPISKISSLKVVPIGTSTRPTLFTFPPKAKTLVPLEPAVPIEANLSAPSLKIQETDARVSTLLIIDGFCHNPLIAGKGGLGRGIPRFPSIEFKRAVSSPHTNAPAPKRI